MPLQSMTGFARNSKSHNAHSWTWEVRSVNAKGLDVRCRVPHGFEALDVQARGLVSKTFKRGNITINLALQNTENQNSFRINQDVLTQMVSAMAMLKDKIPDAKPPRLDGLLALKGVIETVETDEDDSLRETLHALMLESLTDALDDLKAHRLEEGARLEAVLKDQMSEIATLTKKAKETAGVQPEAIRARLLRQLRDVMENINDLDEDRISQEAALLMTKADVCEELDRLGAHVEGAEKLLKQGSPCGRKLDFLCQEFNREANTLCSKSQDVSLTRVGLEFKAVIDQFREQVQNIE